jgi:hypothetical protein
MAVAGIKIGVQFPELDALRKGLRALGDKKAASVLLGEALERAIFPAYLRLREVTPVGPTGNLKRAATYKVKVYPRTGGAVGLIGYTRAAKQESRSAQGGDVEAGPDRGFHQWWLEFGTKQRTVPGRRSTGNNPKARKYDRRSPTAPFVRTRVRNGKTITETVRGRGVLHPVSELKLTYIASSYNSLGPFEMVNGKPDRQHAFFKKSKTPIIIPAMKPGGIAGRPPVQTAWNQTKAQVAATLTRELRISLEAAVSTLVLRSTGSITGALTAAGG